MQPGEGPQALLDPAVVDEPARGLGEEEDEQREDGGGDDLDAEGEAPLGGVVVVEADICACGSRSISFMSCSMGWIGNQSYRRRSKLQSGRQHQA